jgi:signal transduction histidine kinase
MNSSNALSRLPVAGLLVLVAGALGWLLLGYATDDGAGRRLPMAEGSVEFWREGGREVSREHVERLAAGAWQTLARPERLLWKNGEALWVRVTLRNPSEGEWRGVLAERDFFLDRVDAWVKDGAAWTHLRSGEAVPAAEKPVAGREVAIPVAVPAGGERVVLLRAQDRVANNLRLAWWPSQGAFQTMQTRRALAEGIYLGLLLALLGYNALLWLRLRLADIGYYVLYLGTAAAFMLLARAQLVALGWHGESPRLETALTFALALSGFFLTRFARAFLELEQAPAAWERALVFALQVWALGLAAGALTTPWFQTMMWLVWAVPAVGVTHVALLGLAVLAWRRGVRQARFFVASFGCLFAGSLPTVAAWIWDDSLKELTLQGLMVGSGLEMLLLSLATADRFAQAQRRVVEETEQRRAIQEAYADELETEVRERTRELEEANTDKDRMLAVIGHDLRSPLTGLMKAAGLAGGDFGREATRTARALLLMIEDLVLWARLRAGTREFAAHPARAVLQPAVALHRALADSGETQLVVEVPEALRVETDLVLAQTLVRNLLANALKFARTRVELRASENGDGGVMFTVSNDGPTLPADVIARLDAGEHEPMTATGGLGLRLCREICAALGMKLEARVPAGGGAEFAFTLPAAVALEVEEIT